MKVSVSFFLMAILTTIFSIITISFYGANEQYLKAQRQHEEVMLLLENSDFSETTITSIQRKYNSVTVIRDNDYMYRIITKLRYKIPVLFYQEERTIRSILYRGGW